MELILDLVLIAIIVLTVYAGYKNGLIKTVAGLFGGIISFFVARFAANALAPTFAGVMPVPELGETLSTKINSVLLQSDASLSVQALLEGIGLPTSLTAHLREETGTALAGAAGTAADMVTSALAELLAWCILFLVAFILCALLIRLLCVWLNIFAKLPVVRTLNSLLGALAGLLAGVFLAWLFAVLLAWLGPVIAVTVDVDISTLNFSHTYLFNYFSSFNPLKLLF